MYQSNSSRRKKTKCPAPKSNFMMYMDEGVMHYRVGHYQKAVCSFDQVQKKNIHFTLHNFLYWVRAYIYYLLLPYL